MEEAIPHQAMRNELLEWLSDALCEDSGLDGLCEFLTDDFPYDAEHVVGLVLHKNELEPWQRLMDAIESVSDPAGQGQIALVRERAAALLATMRS